MANRAGRAVLVLAAALTPGGCGTAENLIVQKGVPPHRTHCLSADAQVFGGVLGDLGMLQVVTVGGRKGNWGPDEPWRDAAAAGLLLLDLPISTVGDTLTLPLAAYATWKRLTAEAPRPTPPADNPPGD